MTTKDELHTYVDEMTKEEADRWVIFARAMLSARQAEQQPPAL